jgi:phosphatidylserine/phosphatidylglycerophosphate/cardiolipin synthase-like enzyme
MNTPHRLNSFGGRQARVGRAAGMALLLAVAASPLPAAAQRHAQADVSACFVPEEHCTGEIVAALDAARAEIRVQAFAFSSRPIAVALKAAHDRGIDVQVVVDRSNEGFRGGVTDGLAAAGVPVFIDWSPAIAHSKVMIVDRHLVIGGSFNYSAAADSRNAENVTFIDSPEVAGWFLANWQSRRDVSEAWRGE